jgi:hypothetical protein
MIYNFPTMSFFIGFFGDLLLQIIVKIRGNIANLKIYFEQHNGLESMFIAGGMMFLFAYLYDLFLLQKSFICVFLYGGILDIIWRQFQLFPSLTYTYYTANNQLESFIWGGIPMILPLFFI